MKTKSFTLIKEYPGSSALNTVFTSAEDGKLYKNWGTYLDPADVEDNPEFFEEIIQKEYEILELYTTNHNKHYFLREDGNYSFKSAEYGNSFENCQRHGWQIFSIKRLSDNEVFSIGDGVIWGQTYIISHFNIHNDYLYVYVKHLKRDDTFAVKYTDIKKSKPVLFVTEDGVEVYRGDVVWRVHSGWSLEGFRAESVLIYSPRIITSSKEKAEEYIMYNKPCLSLKDVASIYPGINKDHNSPSHQAELLKELVKSRL